MKGSSSDTQRMSRSELERIVAAEDEDTMPLSELVAALHVFCYGRLFYFGVFDIYYVFNTFCFLFLKPLPFYIFGFQLSFVSQICGIGLKKFKIIFSDLILKIKVILSRITECLSCNEKQKGWHTKFQNRQKCSKRTLKLFASRFSAT